MAAGACQSARNRANPSSREPVGQGRASRAARGGDWRAVACGLAAWPTRHWGPGACAKPGVGSGSRACTEVERNDGDLQTRDQEALRQVLSQRLRGRRPAGARNPRIGEHQRGARKTEERIPERHLQRRRFGDLPRDCLRRRPPARAHRARRRLLSRLRPPHRPAASRGARASRFAGRCRPPAYSAANCSSSWRCFFETRVGMVTRTCRNRSPRPWPRRCGTP